MRLLKHAHLFVRWTPYFSTFHSQEANLLLYSASISACGKASEGTKALQLMSHLTSHRENNAITLNAGISACEKATLWQDALRLLEMGKRHGFDCFFTSESKNKLNKVAGPGRSRGTFFSPNQLWGFLMLLWQLLWIVIVKPWPRDAGPTWMACSDSRVLRL